MAVKNKFSFRKCSGLIAAKNVDAPEILHRRQILDDDLLAGHVNRSTSQSYRCDHGKELRRESDRKGDGEDQRLQRISLENGIRKKNEKNQKHDSPHNEHSELSGASIEFCFGSSSRETSGDFTEGSFGPCNCYYGRCASTHDRSSQVY